MITLTIPAREVRVGDIVHPQGRASFRVHHAMTTGKKSRVTSLAPLLADPLHLPADAPVTIERD